MHNYVVNNIAEAAVIQLFDFAMQFCISIAD